MLSGMAGLARMEDHLSHIKDFQPLNGAEPAAVPKARKAINAVFAPGCFL